jgi:hypothetical protein
MEHIDKTIEELKSKVAEKEKELNEVKKTANNVCQMFGRPPLYVIDEQSPTVLTRQLRGDEYYGHPLATVITGILEARKAQGAGPATMREIYDQMIAGGYQFEAKGADNAMRGMRISMAKNQKFHKLPNGKWGLIEWYPKAKESKEKEAKEIENIITKIKEEAKEETK